METVESTLRSLVFCLIFVACGNFLCLFSVWETLRIKWPWFVPLTLAQAVAYYGLRVLSWLGILPYLALAFFIYCKVAAVQPRKLLFLLLVVVTYLLFSNTVFYLFEGSSYTWDWADLDTVLLGFATSMGPMTWLLRRKIWPALRAMQTDNVPWLGAIPTVFIVMNVILCSSHVQYQLSDRLAPAYMGITSLFSIATAGVCFLMLDMLKKAQEITQYEGNMRLIDAQLASQHKRFNDVAEHMNRVRILRHDMRHHLRVVNELIAEGQYDNAREYLKDYTYETEQQSSLHFSQNFVGDIIASRSYESAKALGVDITILCALPRECVVADTDLCVILGNLMENALNACKRQASGRKYIYATAKQEGSEVAITIENSCNPEVAKPPAQESGTGQGIPSIHAIAEKYGGKATFRQEGSIFYAAVLLFKV